MPIPMPMRRLLLLLLLVIPRLLLTLERPLGILLPASSLLLL